MGPRCASGAPPLSATEIGNESRRPGRGRTNPKACGRTPLRRIILMTKRRAPMLAAEVDEYRVIDTDTHVIEPYDLWTSRLSVAKWGDKVPHVKWDEEKQEDSWFFGSQRTGAAAGAAMAGWHENPPARPQRLSEGGPPPSDNAER